MVRNTFKKSGKEVKTLYPPRFPLSSAVLGEQWEDVQENTGYLLEGRKGDKIEREVGSPPVNYDLPPVVIPLVK
jgi:hypothetical protein